MANRFFSPNEQFSDATGLPYAGGSLTFYASGTTTPLATYQDRALTIANTNPVVLDSAGRAGNVFLQNLAYKVILEDVNNNVIWTEDPVYSSDFSTVAQFQSGSGSPNGVLAGTAGSSTIPASSYWDATNNILYVCTQTGNAATAVWTAVNATTAAAVVPPPQGYLTPTSQTPVILSEVLAATTVFYTPYVGNLIPIYNGTSFTPTVFSEISCSLVSAHAANTLYDFFVFNNSGVLTLVTGPAWNVSTAGSGARGAGAGTTQIGKIGGTWVNQVSMTGRNGATTYTIPANQATYVGSIYIDATAGQVTLHRTVGQNRKFGLWNAYNRVPIILQVTDGTAASWPYNSTVVRASNNNPPAYSSTVFNAGSGTPANGAAIFAGLPEEMATINFVQSVTLSQNTGGRNFIGINSTTAAGGKNGLASSSTATITEAQDMLAVITQPPASGINFAVCLEDAINTNATQFQGGTNGMVMTVIYRG